VTLFPFLGRPDRHPILRPGSTREAAERLGFDLRFDDNPNWSTYAALRGLSGRLLEALAGAGAKDFIDVEVFSHAASTMRASGTKRAAKRTERAAAKAAAKAAVKVVEAAPKAPPAAVKPAPKGKGKATRAVSRAVSVRAKPAARDTKRRSRNAKSTRGNR
jgi:hypothetical protein